MQFGQLLGATNACDCDAWLGVPAATLAWRAAIRPSLDFRHASQVTCTATDSSGNIATGTFTVRDLHPLGEPPQRCLQTRRGAQAPTQPNPAQRDSISPTPPLLPPIPKWQVVVSQPPPPPSFGPTPDGTFEATTATPYLGTTLNGKYAPTATDPVQGDVSASIKTYLTATNEQIYLSGLSSYLFPLGATAVRNVLRDDYGRVFEQAATIAVADRTPPALSVAGPAEVLLAGPGAVDYAGKVRAVRQRRHSPWACAVTPAPLARRRSAVGFSSLGSPRPRRSPAGGVRVVESGTRGPRGFGTDTAARPGRTCGDTKCLPATVQTLPSAALSHSQTPTVHRHRPGACHRYLQPALWWDSGHGTLPGPFDHQGGPNR
jgi:hypothetical protein